MPKGSSTRSKGTKKTQLKAEQPSPTADDVMAMQEQKKAEAKKKKPGKVSPQPDREAQQNSPPPQEVPPPLHQWPDGNADSYDPSNGLLQEVMPEYSPTPKNPSPATDLLEQLGSTEDFDLQPSSPPLRIRLLRYITTNPRQLGP